MLARVHHLHIIIVLVAEVPREACSVTHSGMRLNFGVTIMSYLDDLQHLLRFIHRKCTSHWWIGGITQLVIFRSQVQLANFLKSVKSGPTGLIINGDLIDFLAVNLLAYLIAKRPKKRSIRLSPRRPTTSVGRLSRFLARPTWARYSVQTAQPNRWLGGV